MTATPTLQLNLYEIEAPGAYENAARNLVLDGFWPTEIPLAGDPYRDEYAIGVEGVRIVRVAGVGIDGNDRGLGPDVTSLRPGHPVRLVPEPENRFDDQAILVLADEDTEKAGYIPRTMNVGVAKWWFESPSAKAWVLCQWVDPSTMVLWDGDNCGGFGHLALSMHLLLVHPEAIPRIDRDFIGI